MDVGYKGSKWQTPEQKSDLAHAWIRHPNLAKTTDFVCGWIARYLDYAENIPEAVAAFVTTNSICQGQQASDIWQIVFKKNIEICFAHTAFKWNNLASDNAGVTVIIVGLASKSTTLKRIFSDDQVRECSIISPYLVPNMNNVVQKQSEPIGQQSKMLFGNMPRDGGYLFLRTDEANDLLANKETAKFIRRFIGSEELINGRQRYCLWIEDSQVSDALKSDFISERLKLVAENRRKSQAQSTRDFASKPYRFVQIGGTAEKYQILVAGVSSENRNYLPCHYLTAKNIVSNKCFALYDSPLWNMALIASRLHWVWIGTVCVRLEMRFSYSNTLGWNTFPVPTLTDQNKTDLTRCAEDILLAREHYFPATIADMYNPDRMDQEFPLVREAHERNDETIERIYIGRRFKNDTERLEKLFEMYSKMISKTEIGKKSPQRKNKT